MGLVAAALAVASIGVIATPGAAGATGADRDCGDFGTQAEAQRFFIDAGGPGSDPHRLDYDGDGVACETRPCPCSTAGAGAGRPEPKPQRLRARVLKAIDGDTIQVRVPSRANRKLSVRLLGIDTPEKYGARECAAGAASRYTSRLLKGKRVKLTTDPSQDRRDRYGRLLAYVDRGGRSAQVAILARGLGRVYAVDGVFRRITRFRNAESRARNAGRGAWSACGGDFHRPATAG